MREGHLVIRHGAQALLVNTGCRSRWDVDRPSNSSIGRFALQRYHGMTVEQWSEVIGIKHRRRGEPLDQLLAPALSATRRRSSVIQFGQTMS
jgi:hypothetical protein